MPYELKFCGRSDIGLKRTNNEDTYRIDAHLGYCLVADGMGGAAAGELASHIFSETTRNIFLNTDERRPNDFIECIQNIFRSANENIIHHIRQNPKHGGMGCTAELIVFSDKHFYLGHIGDSRTYRFRNGSSKQLTQDHTLIQERIDRGLMSKEDARKHPLRNVIQRAIGINKRIALDLVKGTIHPGDQFLLCSDGLTDMVEDSLIEKALFSDMTLEQKTGRLIDIALSAGGNDNVTVVLVEIV
jgi:protein phosphatase